MGYWGLDIYSADHTMDELDAASHLCKKLHKGLTLSPEEQAELQSWLGRARTHAPVLFLIHTGNARLVSLNHLLIAEASVLEELHNVTSRTHVFKPHSVNEFIVKGHYRAHLDARMPADVQTALYVLQYKHDLVLIRNVMAAKTGGTAGLPERMTSLPTPGGKEGGHYYKPVWNNNCGLDWGSII